MRCTYPGISLRSYLLMVAFTVMCHETRGQIVTFGTENIDKLVLAGPQLEGAVTYQAISGLGWEIVNINDSRGNPPSALATSFNGIGPDQSIGNKVEFWLSDGGLFKFDSVDTLGAGRTSSQHGDYFPPDMVTITGTRANMVVGSISPPASETYITRSGFDGLIDRLTVTLSYKGSTAFWVDNIRIAIIPEPSALALLFLGSVCLLRRR